ncbi:MAG: peptidoglycan-binding protein, partial [Erysipelotrichales bacterium]|nr:peptidoglycan-binding protein [Erysipelotrichales bacterium]
LQEGLGATVIGTTTYGKGTMQVPLVMGDGSILRYTTAEWLTTNGNTINGKGIEPDIYVENEDVYKNAVTLKEDAAYGYDSVSSYTVLAQEMLDYLGYSVDRQDGYFSKATQTALQDFEKDHGLIVDGILDNATYQEIVAANFRNWFAKKEEHDLQMKTALEWVKQ